ncbi:unnamed protein product, partial [Staurois parvus]
MSSSETPQPLLEQLQCLAQRVDVQQAYQEQIIHCLQELYSQLDQLQVVSTSSPSVSATVPVPVPVPAAPTPAVPPVEHSPSKLQLPPPHHFSGDPKACRGFINQSSIHFELAADHFPTDRSKVAYMISLLSGEALAWAS